MVNRIICGILSPPRPRNFRILGNTQTPLHIYIYCSFKFSGGEKERSDNFFPFPVSLVPRKIAETLPPFWGSRVSFFSFLFSLKLVFNSRTTSISLILVMDPCYALRIE